MKLHTLWSGIFVLVTLGLSQASLDNIQTDPTLCSLETFSSVENFGEAQSITAHPTLASTFFIGTSQEILLTTESAPAISLTTSNMDVRGLEIAQDGSLLVADRNGYCIRNMETTSLLFQPVWAGSCGSYGDVLGSFLNARFGELFDLTSNSAKNMFYVIEREQVIKQLHPGTNIVTKKITGINQMKALVVDVDGTLFFSAERSVYKSLENSSHYELVAGGGSQSGSDDGSLTSARFQDIMGLAYLAAQNIVLAAGKGNKALRMIDPDNNEVTTLCSENNPQGSMVDCGLDGPSGLFIEGDSLMVVDDDKVKIITCQSVESAVPTTVPSPTTTTMAGPTDYYKVIERETFHSLWLSKTREDDSACNGTGSRQLHTATLHHCANACLTSLSCQCIAHGGVRCSIYDQ